MNLVSFWRGVQPARSAGEEEDEEEEDIGGLGWVGLIEA